MNISYKYHPVHVMHSFYEGSLLLFYVLGLVATVALGAFGLETLFSTLDRVG